MWTLSVDDGKDIGHRVHCVYYGSDEANDGSEGGIERNEEDNKAQKKESECDVENDGESADDSEDVPFAQTVEPVKSNKAAIAGCTRRN